MTLDQVLTQATDTDRFLVGTDVLPRTAEIFRELFPGSVARIVADENTMQAAGGKVAAILESEGIPQESPVIFPGTPPIHADYRHIETLRDTISDSECIPIAVGSGTINDIVKRAAHETGRRYMVVATAASVDGYTSFGAAILTEGFKQTLECAAPLGIIADTDVLMTAPPEMAAAGYADLMSKITAGADWLIADAVGADPLDPLGWDMVQPPLRTWLRDPGKLKQQDRRVFSAVFEGLAYTGFSMQAMRRSRPASGSEHLISHIWEMEGLTVDGNSISHGFKVSLGILIITALIEVFFSLDSDDFNREKLIAEWPSREQGEAEVRAMFAGLPGSDRILREYGAKYIDRESLDGRLERIGTCWSGMRRDVLKHLYPFDQLKAMLAAAECPLQPAEFGLSAQQVIDTVRKASKIRNRYTILDIATECGVLEMCVQEVFKRNYFTQE